MKVALSAAVIRHPKHVRTAFKGRKITLNCVDMVCVINTYIHRRKQAVTV